MYLIWLLLIVILITLLKPRSEGFTDNLGISGTLHTRKIQTTGSVIPQKIEMKVAWNPYVAATLPILISQFGFPDVVDINREGLAIWKRNTLLERGWCWYQVTLRDVPRTWIRVAYRLALDQHLKPEELPEVLKLLANLNPSIYFDRSNQTLNASGQSLEDCSTLLLTAKRLALKEINLIQAQVAIDSIRASMDPYSNTSDLYAHDKAKLELCSVDLPKANALGTLPPNELFNLRPGGALKAWSALPGQVISREVPFQADP